MKDTDHLLRARALMHQAWDELADAPPSEQVDTSRGLVNRAMREIALLSGEDRRLPIMVRFRNYIRRYWTSIAIGLSAVGLTVLDWPLILILPVTAVLLTVDSWIERRK